jgi:hypothetical protein
VHLTGMCLMGVYLITLFRGCTATGDIAGSCLQGCGLSGSAALPASAGISLKYHGLGPNPPHAPPEAIPRDLSTRLRTVSSQLRVSSFFSSLLLRSVVLSNYRRVPSSILSSRQSTMNHTYLNTLFKLCEWTQSTASNQPKNVVRSAAAWRHGI